MRAVQRLLPTLLILLAALPTSGASRTGPDGETYYFYHGRDYGSEALVNPLQLVVNGGFGIMQLGNRHNRPFDVDYANGWRNVWRNLKDPVAAIEQEGWRDFFQREIIPISFNSGKAHYWPNYTQHLIGGGMSFRQTMEWYRWNGYDNPKRWAAVTLMSYHLLNEVVENDKRTTWTTDPVADLYIFDPASILLFSSDRVAGFFSDVLNMADWSYQPVFDPVHETLINNGQNFAMKWKLPWSDHWSLFYHYGTHGEFGASYTWDSGDCLSFGAGLSADTLVEITQFHDGVDLGVATGVFYDRHGSLLASLLMAKTKDNSMRLNVYPGLVDVFGMKTGLYVGTNRDRDLQVGVNLLRLPLGLGYGHAPKDE